MAHFICFDEQQDYNQTSEAFYNNVIKNHGIPSKIITEAPIRTQSYGYNNIDCNNKYAYWDENNKTWNNFKHILEVTKYKIFSYEGNDSLPVFKKRTWVLLKRSKNYKLFQNYKAETRKFGPFNITFTCSDVGFYTIDIRRSPFPYFYNSFHASELILFEYGNEDYPNEIDEILDTCCRHTESGDIFEYLVKTNFYNEVEWVNADIIDNNKNYDK